MIDTVVCAAPAGIDGSGRLRVPVLPWATGGAMPTATRGIELAASPAPLGTTGVGSGAQPGGTPPFGTTNVHTLGNHPPGRPRS